MCCWVVWLCSQQGCEVFQGLGGARGLMEGAVNSASDVMCAEFSCVVMLAGGW